MLIFRFYFLLGITIFLLTSCANNKHALAKLTLSTKEGEIEEPITGLAKGSKYERLYWYIGDVLQPECQNRPECTFLFDEIGEFEIKLEATITPVSGVTGWQTLTKSSDTETLIIQ